MNNKLFIVGIGPNNIEFMTKKSIEILNNSDIIVGYSKYVERIKNDFKHAEYICTGMRTETERVIKALELSESGKKVSLISSGDSGVYGMASLALELSKNYKVDIEIIPGITVANSAASIIGSPLTLDYAVISLSDILVDWQTIVKRLECFAESGVSTVIYNPKSKTRDWQLKKAFDIFKNIRNNFYVCVVKNAFMDSQHILISHCDNYDWIDSVDMMSVVYFCDEKTIKINEKLVVPRGYVK